MAVITFTIQDSKLPRVVSAIKGLHPIPTDINGQPLFTENQWAKEYYRRMIVGDVMAWERQVAAGNVTSDDSIAS